MEPLKVYIIDTKVNLCDTCIHEVATCDANATQGDIEFGDGFGNDNVIKCKYYSNGDSNGR